MSLFDPGAIFVLGFPVWLMLSPTQVVRFYRWFGRNAGVDRRRLDALTPNRFRISGSLFLAFELVVLIFGNR